MVMIVDMYRKTRKFKLANRILLAVCFSATISSGQELPVKVVLDDKPNPKGVLIYQTVKAIFSHSENTKYSCFCGDIKLSETNVSSINSTTSEFTCLMKPHCNKNTCNKKFLVTCTIIDSNSSTTSKSATIYLKGISEVRNLTIDFTNLSIEMSWFIPLFRSSLTIVYKIIGINETGVVVLNETTEDTSYLLYNVTTCLYNVTIVAIQDGNTSSVTKEVKYPDGYCDNTSPASPSSSTVLTQSDSASFRSSSTVLTQSDSTSFRPSSTVLTPTDSTSFRPSSTVLTDTTSPTGGPTNNFIVEVVIGLIVSLIACCLIVSPVACLIYYHKFRDKTGSSRNTSQLNPHLPVERQSGYTYNHQWRLCKRSIY